MEITVMKFGGSSVADNGKLASAAAKIAAEAKLGRCVAAIVSAQGKTTDKLIAQAREVNEAPSPREMDVLLSAGEQMSSALLAMAVAAQGVPAEAMSGEQAGFITDGVFGSARITNLEPGRVLNAFAQGKAVIVAGFQGVCGGDITTLGRGGSDTSAVALAAALGASRCIIYTDVDGVYTADPKAVPGARKLSGITYDEMLEMASSGAKVMHNRSIELAKKYGVPLEVRSSFSGNAGTQIKERYSLEEILIRGVTCDVNSAKIALVGVKDVPGIACTLFSALAEHSITADMILQSLGREGTQDITFTVTQNLADRALAVLDGINSQLGAKRTECDRDVAKISVIGAGVMENPQVAATMFAALRDAGINIQMISTSEIKLSVVVSGEEAHKALSAVHGAFFGG